MTCIPLDMGIIIGLVLLLVAINPSNMLLVFEPVVLLGVVLFTAGNVGVGTGAAEDIASFIKSNANEVML